MCEPDESGGSWSERATSPVPTQFARSMRSRIHGPSPSRTESRTDSRPPSFLETTSFVSFLHAQGRAGEGGPFPQGKSFHKRSVARNHRHPNLSPSIGREEPVSSLMERVRLVIDPPIPLNELLNSPHPALGEGSGVRVNRLGARFLGRLPRQGFPLSSG
jgi:hypothetical protein